MSELSRTFALASRYTELGSGIEDWNGMGTAWEYRSDAKYEHNAVREAADMFDKGAFCGKLAIPFFDRDKSRTHA